MNWQQYLGRKVSIIITGKNDNTDNYVGIVATVEDGWLTLDINNPKLPLEKLIVKIDSIHSIWLYKVQKKKK